MTELKERDRGGELEVFTEDVEPDDAIAMIGIVGPGLGGDAPSRSSRTTSRSSLSNIFSRLLRENIVVRYDRRFSFSIAIIDPVLLRGDVAGDCRELGDRGDVGLFDRTLEDEICGIE